MKRSPMSRAAPKVKAVKLRKCSVCKVQFSQVRPLQVACGTACALAYAAVKSAKQAAKEKRVERAATKLALDAVRPRSYYVKQAQAAFNAYVRARDAECPCISCGRHHQGQNHAGHYLSVGAHPNLRFNLNNVWKQCQPCNMHLSGNQLKYRRNLIVRIGLVAVEALESDHEPKKYDINSLKEITKTYRKKLKEITHGTP